ncbi:hypothetical protein BJA01nite_57370 [Bradyrhizobium japonicum]|nr:hypothetical protein BJ6T_71010 [Bradyrhizobium japonicum USDA 6]GEC48095.1 hypothetical protein BJA01nite_57370 [Bradyrhizobium japonicum]
MGACRDRSANFIASTLPGEDMVTGALAPPAALMLETDPNRNVAATTVTPSLIDIIILLSR